MNKELIIKRFSKAMKSYDEEAYVQHQIARELCQQLLIHSVTTYPTITEIGCGTGYYTRQLLKNYPEAQYKLNDICPSMVDCLEPLLNENVTFQAGDAEQLILPEQQSLITSSSVFQWFERLAPFLKRCALALQPEGILAFSTFGPRNMHEITALTQMTLPYYSLDEIVQMLSVDYDIIYTRQDELGFHFEDAMQVLYHLKYTGVSAVAAQPWSRGKLRDFCHQYEQLFGEEKGVKLTYHPLYIIAKKKSL